MVLKLSIWIRVRAKPAACIRRRQIAAWGPRIIRHRRDGNRAIERRVIRPQFPVRHDPAVGEGHVTARPIGHHGHRCPSQKAVDDETFEHAGSTSGLFIRSGSVTASGKKIRRAACVLFSNPHHILRRYFSSGKAGGGYAKPAHLCRWHATRSDAGRQAEKEDLMLDLIFIAIGIAGLAYLAMHYRRRR